MKSRRIDHGVNSKLKHITVIIDIAITGEHMIPCVWTLHEEEKTPKIPRKKGIESGDIGL
jgi:hypothetical protein